LNDSNRQDRQQWLVKEYSLSPQEAEAITSLLDRDRVSYKALCKLLQTLDRSVVLQFETLEDPHKIYRNQGALKQGRLIESLIKKVMED
jgi:hypothetical protein